MSTTKPVRWTETQWATFLALPIMIKIMVVRDIMSGAKAAQALAEWSVTTHSIPVMSAAEADR